MALRSVAGFNAEFINANELSRSAKRVTTDEQLLTAKAGVAGGVRAMWIPTGDVKSCRVARRRLLRHVVRVERQQVPRHS